MADDRTHEDIAFDLSRAIMRAAAEAQEAGLPAGAIVGELEIIKAVMTTAAVEGIHRQLDETPWLDS